MLLQVETLIEDIQTYTPQIFLEKYNVDVVLCGHSHSYERSYLIKGFKGNSETFDPAKHAVSASSGRYDGTPNSAPYIKKLTNKGTGTVYLVGGSSGQLGGKSAGYPHHAMAFSNESIPGSCILTFEDTRLDLKWLGGDDSIHDKFTMFKGVNRHNYVEIVKGDSVTLTASWPGDYIWSNGATTRSITVSPAEAQDYIVKDVLGYLADTNSVSLKVANAINDKTANVQVSIYPNPSNGNGTQLTINQCIDKQVNVQVTNLLGQQILPVKTIKLSNGMATEWLPLTVKGLYLVHLQGINTNTTVQVEVQ